MTADARHHVRVGGDTFCTMEWVELPDPGARAGVVYCPHGASPLRSTTIRRPAVTTRATALLNGRS